MKKNNSNKKIYIFFFLILFFVTLLIVHKGFQNDTFYTIKVGEIIDKYGVDMKDHFSFVKGLSYSYPHWLYDLIIYKLYSFAGFRGLFISNIVLTYTLLTTMFLTIKKIIKDGGIAFLITCLFSPFLSGFITVRAQLVSYILLLLILYCIEMIRSTGKNRYIIISFILSILVVNIHCAVFPFIFVLFLPFLTSDLIYVLKNKFFSKTELIDNNSAILSIDKPSNDKKMFLMVILILISGFLSPNAPYAYLYLPFILMGNSTSYILEHMPASIQNNVFIYFFLLLFILILLIPKVKIKLHDLFMILGLFIMSFLSIRSFSLFVVMSIYAFARISYVITYNKLKHIKLIDAFKYKHFYIILFLLASTGATVSFYFELKNDYVAKNQYPVEMVKFIKDNYDYKNIRILNDYNFGSYLLYNDIPVFVDSRSDLYLPQFNKDNTQFIDFMEIIPRYKIVLQKYDFTHILIYNKANFNRILDNIEEYKLVKQDKYYSLYEKR